MAAFSSASFSTSAFSTAAFDFGDTPPPVIVPVPQGGGTSRRIRGLPQYYSRKIYDSGRIALPQEPKSNEVAIEVLDDARELEIRLSKDDRDFSDMLEIIEHLLKQVATYIESQQIYNIVTDIELRIRARQDAQRREAEQDEEFGELLMIV